VYVPVLSFSIRAILPELNVIGYNSASIYVHLWRFINVYLLTYLLIQTALQLESASCAGLSVVFNTDQDRYVGDLTDGAGIRVVVHNQTDMPFPDVDSVAVSPGTLTYIGASLVSQLSRRLTNVLSEPTID